MALMLFCTRCYLCIQSEIFIGDPSSAKLQEPKRRKPGMETSAEGRKEGPFEREVERGGKSNCTDNENS